MVECHTADNQIIRAFQHIAPLNIAILDSYIVQLPVLDFSPEDIKHALGTVDTGYGTNKWLQLQSHESRAAAKVQNIHIRSQRNFICYGISNIMGQFHPGRNVVPRSRFFVKIPF